VSAVRSRSTTSRICSAGHLRRPGATRSLAIAPERIAQIRSLTAGARLLRAGDDPERPRALAQRAAFSLPYGQLLLYTPDPLGDLAAQRYDALVAAAFEDAGLRPLLPERA
jgi:hypothetical protein